MTTTHAPSRNITAESAALDRVVEQLTSGLPAVPSDQIVDAVNVAYGHFDRSPIRDFIPILVERRVRRRYRAGDPLDHRA